VKRAELKERLRAEVARWEQKSFVELSAQPFPLTYDVGSPGTPSFYQVEVTMLEGNAEFIHLAVAVSDVGLSAFVPVTGDAIVHARIPK
jgi:hypothetical protein